MDIYSTKITGCRNIYPHRIVHPIGKFPIKHRDQLQSLLSDLNDNSCIITEVIADNPKRAILRECLNHAALYPCEYCEAKGTRLKFNSDFNSATHEKEQELIQERIEITDNTNEVNTLKTI